MRNSKLVTRLVFAGIILVLFLAVLFNYVSRQMSKGAAKGYVPKVTQSKNNSTVITKSNNPAQAFTLTGPVSGKTVKDLGYKPGFYDLHFEGGSSQYWGGETNQNDEYGQLVTDNELMNLEAGKKITFTPAKFAPLAKEGNAYVLANQGNYLPEVQIPTGQYQVTYQGNLTPQSPIPTAKTGSMLLVMLMTYNQQTVPNSTEKDHYNVTLYQSTDPAKPGPSTGIISVEKGRLLHIDMSFVTDPNLKIYLTPIK